MKKLKYLYKITYSKTRENRELFFIISIVTAMIIVFTTMSESISFAYQALVIQEEAAPYLEGQKTAEEVMDIIQSRVEIYLMEGQ